MPGGMVEHPAANNAVTASEIAAFNVADFIRFLFPTAGLP
jgi:hypothetical protein